MYSMADDQISVGDDLHGIDEKENGRGLKVAAGWAGLVLATAVSCFAGLACYIYIENGPPIYEAKATILLNSPQSQYWPAQNDGLSPADPANDPAQEARGILEDGALLGRLVAQYGLAEDERYNKQSLWQSLAELVGMKSGMGGLILPVAAERVKERIQIGFNAARQTLLIGYRAPTPDQATAIANSLAQGYLEAQRRKQLERLGAAVAKLQADVDALKGKSVKAGEEMEPRLAPEGMAGDELAIWQKQEAGRVKLVREQAGAEKAMLDQLLARLQEARSRQAMDLTPPEARLLRRAIMPEQPLPSMATIYAIYVFAFFLVCQIVAIISFQRKRKNSAKMANVPHHVVCHEITDLSDQRYQNQSTGIVANGVEESGQEDSRSDMDIIAALLAGARHKRILLMSEADEWNMLPKLLKPLFEQQDRTLAYLSLGYQSVSLPLGLSDFLDGNADCTQIIQVDEQHSVFGIGPGPRELVSDDFVSQELHVLLLALEAAYDCLIIDIGPYFEDEYALQSLAVAPDAHACVYAPEADPSIVAHVREVVELLGYRDCWIFPDDLRYIKDNPSLVDQLVA